MSWGGNYVGGVTEFSSEGILVHATEGKALVQSAWIYCSRGARRGQYSITVSFWFLWLNHWHFGSESQTFLFGNTDTLPNILVRDVVTYLSAVPYQGLPLDYSSLITEEEHNLWSYWRIRISGNLWGAWVAKNEEIKWLHGYPRNYLSEFFKVKYFGSWAKGCEIIFLLQIAIFIPDPLHAVYVVDLMYEMHPLLPPSTCEELGLVPPSSLCLNDVNDVN